MPQNEGKEIATKIIRLSELYNLIEEYIKVSGYNRNKFAKKAGIEPRTFYNMFSRCSASVIRADNAAKIQIAMREIKSDIKDLYYFGDETHEKEDRYVYEQLSRLEKLMYTYIQMLDSLGALTLEYADVMEALGDDSEDLSSLQKRLLGVFDQLSEKGQETLIERAEELLLIDKYRKADNNDDQYHAPQ